MKFFSLVFLVFVTALIVGCSGPQQPAIQQSTGNVEDVDGLGQDLSTLDTLDEELDTSDLEGVEDDLNADF